MPESFLGDGLIFEELLPLAWSPGPLPEGVRLITRLAPDLDLVQLFVTREVDLVGKLEAARDSLASAGALWVSWPKGKAKAAIPTDVDETIVRSRGLDTGLVDVKVCAVDEVWSGLKFVWRLRDR